MRMQRRPLVVGMAILFAMVLAGCGDDDHNNTRWVYSDLSVDADITRDLGTGLLSDPFFASDTGNVLAGITFVLPSGPSTADTRGFLQFPLSNIPVGAQIDFASMTIFLDAVTLSETALYSPFFLDLIDTVLYPEPIVSSDYSSGYVATRSFNFMSADQGNFVEIEVTSLLREAQALTLPSFRVRIGFDNEVYQSDLSKTRGLVQIYDGADELFVPILRVDYR